MFKGEINRTFFAVAFIVLIVAHIISMASITKGNDTAYFIEWTIYLIALMYISSLRLRNLRMKQRELLYLLIPLLNIILLLQLLFKRGNDLNVSYSIIRKYKISFTTIKMALIILYGTLLSYFALYAPFKITFWGEKMPRIKSYSLYSLDLPEYLYGKKVLKCDLDYSTLGIEMLITTILFCCALYFVNSKSKEEEVRNATKTHPPTN